MRKILLTGPNVRNDQTYVDAGTELVIGDQPDQITADRAKELVDGFGRAEPVTHAATKSA